MMNNNFDSTHQKHKQNPLQPPILHQLSRKVNDSHSRKLDYRYLNNSNNRSIVNNLSKPSEKKRPLSAFESDYVNQPKHSILNQPLKKLAPVSSQELFYPPQSTPSKLARYEPLQNLSPNRIQLNITTDLIHLPKPQKDKNENTSKVDILKPTAWKPINLTSRLNFKVNPLNSNNVVPKSELSTVAQSLKPVTPSLASKPLHSYNITSPLSKVCSPKPVASKRTWDLTTSSLDTIRPSKPSRLMQSIIQTNLPAPVSASKSTTSLTSPSKRKNRAVGPLVSRAKRIIDLDQSSLTIWQSDLDAGVLREARVKKFQVLKTSKSQYSSQIAHCIELDNHGNQLTDEEGVVWKVFLRGDECNQNDRIKLFFPWSTMDNNIILSNRFIVLK